jgi:hypothetical protein
MSDRANLQIQKQLLKDAIVELASRLIKDTDGQLERGGMIEVGKRWIEQLDQKLFELQEIENKL